MGAKVNHTPLGEADRVVAHYLPRRLEERQGVPGSVEVPASLNVEIGGCELSGAPGLVLRKLCEALAKAREAEAAAADGHVMTDLGGAA